MNIKISEKVVSYRLNQNRREDNKETIGAIIKNERLSQGLNQDFVCKDICSISYYSRIENNNVIPTDEFVSKIFAKLNKPVPKEWLLAETSIELIDNFLTAIEYRNMKLIDEEYEKLKDRHDLKVDLIQFVYFINKNNIKLAEPYLTKLHAIQNYFTNDELLLYLEYLASYYLLSNQLEKSEKILSLSIKLQNKFHHIRPLILYKYAWVLSKLNQDIKAIEYAEEALEIFNKNHNVYRSVQCQLLIAIKYSNNYPEDASLIYENILKIAKNSGYIDLEKIISYNLAVNYKKNNEYGKSEIIFLDLLEKYKESYDANIFIEYIDILILQNRIDEAKKYYDILTTINNSAESVMFALKYYNCILYENSIENKIRLYKNEFIPYCAKTNNKIFEIKCRKELCELYEKNKNAQECIEEYKKILSLVNIYKEII